MTGVEVAAIGLGPSNLSLAALAEPLGTLDLQCLESRRSFEWHPGLMLPGAQLQVSYLKDLVSLVDPTNRFSFLNYLVHHNRQYRFLIAHRDTPSRQEFELYYRWVADQLPGIRWGHQVERIEVRDQGFDIHCANGNSTRSRTLVLGTGHSPLIPEFAQPVRGPDVLHSSEFLSVRPRTAGKEVLVVGAGQSGAEVVNHLLSGENELPASVTWLSSRIGVMPLDDSPFTNEWFTPGYIDYFYRLPAARREELLRQQRMASDGASEWLIRDIYRQLYRLDLSDDKRMTYRLLPCRRMTGLTRTNDQRYRATFDNEDTGAQESCQAHVVILCTGYRSALPDYAEGLRPYLAATDGGFEIQPDYSLAWDGPPGLRVYLQNGARHTHGIADPNLSLAAWRSARILNSICGNDVYDLDASQSTVSWSGDSTGVLT
ncbi:lysine N(6)-hydroxylase/L-ornithine N(5)-oxygenase family protein [Streptosporangium algeriense]|uniref:L-lysine N6-monooxygenase MbtG n=1 Tax=Streptosporangium algeriense TaxID=1682748 RepID=A0ABW3DHZ8_9ACTN